LHTDIKAIEWTSATGTTRVTAKCPNCGDADRKRTILRVPWPNRKAADGRASLVDCANCGCGFFYPADTPDYSADAAGGDGALAFYLQQGAGIWSITSNLAELNRPVGTRFLEVGCGFGFGLDYARRMLGWEVLGLDPSPFAAIGREIFRLPIESRYLAANDAALGGRFDVVMASEVIEHVPSPFAFAQTLRFALCDGGTLVLTTPAVEAVTPDTPPGLLIPLLSIGYHLVLQSERSLTTLLRGAGFEEVEVRRMGAASLTARCRCGPSNGASGVVDPRPFGEKRNVYRRYLRDAAATVDSDSDLWFGLTARGYREAVNAADSLSADSLWDSFSAACRRRFDFVPEAVVMESDDTAGETLDVLVAREPLCLGPMLLHRAFHRMLIGEPRASVETLLKQAVVACERLRRSLQYIGIDDGDAEDIAWVSAAEELLCAAERGEAKVPERFARLGPAPSDTTSISDGAFRRTDVYRRRIFVSLVNSAQLDDSDCVADVIGQVETRAALPSTILTDEELNVLFCGAVRELQRPKAKAAAERALELLQQLRTACSRVGDRAGSAATLVAPAREAEILALDRLGRRMEAKALRHTAQRGKEH
jgi:SAM-dependent methyltransferase